MIIADCNKRLSGTFSETLLFMKVRVCKDIDYVSTVNTHYDARQYIVHFKLVRHHGHRFDGFHEICVAINLFL